MLKQQLTGKQGERLNFQNIPKPGSVTVEQTKSKKTELLLLVENGQWPHATITKVKSNV